MTRMISIVLFCLTTTACSVYPPGLPRDRACHEQADAWCDKAGFGQSPGCLVWYVHECEPDGPDGTIDGWAQQNCIAAIGANPKVDQWPKECVDTWR